MSDLNEISASIRSAFVAKNSARDTAISASRELIRHCSEAIRAIHRREWDSAEAKLAVAQQAADDLRAVVADYSDLAHSGYTTDALKEVVEAFATYAIIRDRPLPTPESLQVEGSVYLNGLAEAATELRRFILDILRRPDGDSPEASAEAEHLLDWMDAIYDELVTFDFPDAITGDLRRRTDVVRGVLERTRGDFTTTLQQQRLQSALKRFEARTLSDS
ncbi:MAG: haloacid dehalogenase [Anaerolineae bacterium]|nr:haloacid dehalogenase [Anaerolineae bacterium]